jgi:hypothetical protein
VFVGVKTAGTEERVPQVVLKADVQPLATRRSRLGVSDGDEPGSDALPTAFEATIVSRMNACT